MSLGGICLSYVGLALFIFSDEALGTWALIITYLVVYGIGRGTWVRTYVLTYLFFILQLFLYVLYISHVL